MSSDRADAKAEVADCNRKKALTGNSIVTDPDGFSDARQQRDGRHLGLPDTFRLRLSLCKSHFRTSDEDESKLRT